MKQKQRLLTEVAGVKAANELLATGDYILLIHYLGNIAGVITPMFVLREAGQPLNPEGNRDV